MAISQLKPSPLHGADASATGLLFKRLPDRLFAPLASPNRQRYWSLLCRWHEHRFGPSAPLPPSHGYPIRVIVQDIEEELQDQDIWESEDGHTHDTPLNVRANGVFNRLHESGWLRMERHGVEKKVTMQPAVSHFLTLLISFAETGPVFVSGKIRSIDANLQLVAEGKGAGDSLAEAAEQARNLLEHVRNTSTTVRDLMESMGADITTAQYVQRFFGDYIERVFIGDYRELRTHDHPLSRRPQILRRIEDIHGSDERRNALIAWYEAKRCPGNARRAEQLFERDINRLFELQRIDEYLDRLDDEIRRANKRALAFLDYRLRSLRPVDQMIRWAVQAVVANGRVNSVDPFPPGEMISGERLAEPRRHFERALPSALRKQRPSDVELARSRIMLRARDARTVTPPKLAEFVRRQLNGKTAIDSEQLIMNDIADVRAYQTLSTIGTAMSAKSRHLQLSAESMTRGYRINLTGLSEVENDFVSGPPFTIELRMAAKERKP